MEGDSNHVAKATGKKPPNGSAVFVSDVPSVEDIETVDYIGEISEPVEEPLIESTRKPVEESARTQLWVGDSEELRLSDSPDVGSPAKPATLTVDTVKMKDDEEFEVETSTLKQLPGSLGQPSPNDSGIETTPSEHDEPLSPPDDASSTASSPRLRSGNVLSNSSEDLMTAVLGLSASKESKADSEEMEESLSTSSSQISTPR